MLTPPPALLRAPSAREIRHTLCSCRREFPVALAKWKTTIPLDVVVVEALFSEQLEPSKPHVVLRSAPPDLCFGCAERWMRLSSRPCVPDGIHLLESAASHAIVTPHPVFPAISILRSLAAAGSAHILAAISTPIRILDIR